MAAIDRSNEIQFVRDYVRNAKREVDGLALYTRRFDLYPFDMMGLGLLSKAFSLANAVKLDREAKCPPAEDDGSAIQGQ